MNETNKGSFTIIISKYHHRFLMDLLWYQQKIPAWLCLNRGSLAKRPLDRSEISICILSFYWQSPPLFTVNKVFLSESGWRTQMQKTSPRAPFVWETIREEKLKTFFIRISHLYLFVNTIFLPPTHHHLYISNNLYWYFVFKTFCEHNLV